MEVRERNNTSPPPPPQKKPPRTTFYHISTCGLGVLLRLVKGLVCMSWLTEF